MAEYCNGRDGFKMCGMCAACVMAERVKATERKLKVALNALNKIAHRIIGNSDNLKVIVMKETAKAAIEACK